MLRIGACATKDKGEHRAPRRRFQTESLQDERIKQVNNHLDDAPSNPKPDKWLGNLMGYWMDGEMVTQTVTEFLALLSYNALFLPSVISLQLFPLGLQASILVSSNIFLDQLICNR